MEDVGNGDSAQPAVSLLGRMTGPIGDAPGPGNGSGLELLLPAHQGCLCCLLCGTLQGFPVAPVQDGERGVPPTVGWAQRKWTAGVALETPLGLALDVSSFYALT